jgi:hypothetical protein
MSTFLVCRPDGSHPEIVEAPSPREAIAQAVRHVSVGEIVRGVELHARRLTSQPDHAEHVTYDAAPLTEAHTATDAKLVFTTIPITVPQRTNA